MEKGFVHEGKMSFEGRFGWVFAQRELSVAGVGSFSLEAVILNGNDFNRSGTWVALVVSQCILVI